MTYRPMSNLVGSIEEAQYKDPGIEEYRGNPLIEALPAISSPKDFVRNMANIPPCPPEEKNLDPHLRIHCVMRLTHFVQPLNRHVGTEQGVSLLIRQGYLSRNPKRASFARMLRHVALTANNPELAEKELKLFPVPKPLSSGMAIVGVSGLGKSTTVERILGMYPQVIDHKELNHKQIVWMKLDCPHDASLKGLCIKFFETLDELFGTNEASKLAESTAMTANKLLVRMKLRALTYSLGVLVIDEVQNLNEASSGGEKKMLNFFVELINEIGVPVILIGTPSIEHVFRKTLRDGRRLTGVADFAWTRMDEKDKEWRTFLKSLWRFQWIKNFTPLTEPLLRKMYQETQGINDLAVKLFIISQFRAISTGSEKLSVRLLGAVAKDAFAHIRPVLDAIESGKKRDLEVFPDIYEPIILEGYLDPAVDLVDRSIRANHEEEQVDEILSWVMAAGIDRKVAEEAIRQTVCKDSQKWKIHALQAALSLIMEEPTSDSEQNEIDFVEEVSPRRSDSGPAKRSKSVDTPMINAMKAGKDENKTNYQSMLDAGFVQNPVKLFVTG